MSLQRRKGLGITLGCDPAGGTNYAVLGNIVDGFDHGGAKADVVDATIAVDTYKQKLKAQIDSGEISLKVCYDPKDANSHILAALMADTSYAMPTWQISYPAVAVNTSATENFSALVTGLGRKIAIKELLVAPVTLTISGDPGFTQS